jgi:uncharacterized protein YciI
MAASTRTTYHLLLYDLTDVTVAKDQPVHVEHRAHVRAAFERGHLVLAGPFVPEDGGALLFRTADHQSVTRFVESDPYVKMGIITNWRIKRLDAALDATIASR